MEMTRAVIIGWIVAVARTAFAGEAVPVTGWVVDEQGRPVPSAGCFTVWAYNYRSATRSYC